MVQKISSGLIRTAKTKGLHGIAPQHINSMLLENRRIEIARRMDPSMRLLSNTEFMKMQIIQKQSGYNSLNSYGTSHIPRNIDIASNARFISKLITIDKGVPPAGYKGGKLFQNEPRGNAQKLPVGVKYKEYDIHSYKKGENRGTERLVFGDDGSVWYTKDHYKTFIRLKKKGKK